MHMLALLTMVKVMLHGYCQIWVSNLLSKICCSALKPLIQENKMN